MKTKLIIATLICTFSLISTSCEESDMDDIQLETMETTDAELKDWWDLETQAVLDEKGDTKITWD